MNDQAIDQAIVVLNRAVKSDSGAMARLCSHREPCTRALAEDPTIQVGTWEDVTKVGMIGIINGLFGINEEGWGHIAAVFESCGTLSGFRRTTPEDWK